MNDSNIDNTLENREDIWIDDTEMEVNNIQKLGQQETSDNDNNIDDTLEDIEELLKDHTEEEVRKIKKLKQQETNVNDRNNTNPEYIGVDRRAHTKADKKDSPIKENKG